MQCALLRSACVCPVKRHHGLCLEPTNLHGEQRSTCKSALQGCLAPDCLAQHGCAQLNLAASECAQVMVCGNRGMGAVKRSLMVSVT